MDVLVAGRREVVAAGVVAEDGAEVEVPGVGRGEVGALGVDPQLQGASLVRQVPRQVVPGQWRSTHPPRTVILTDAEPCFTWAVSSAIVPFHTAKPDVLSKSSSSGPDEKLRRRAAAGICSDVTMAG